MLIYWQWSRVGSAQPVTFLRGEDSSGEQGGNIINWWTETEKSAVKITNVQIWNIWPIYQGPQLRISISQSAGQVLMDSVCLRSNAVLLNILIQQHLSSLILTAVLTDPIWCRPGPLTTPRRHLPNSLRLSIPGAGLRQSWGRADWWSTHLSPPQQT